MVKISLKQQIHFNVKDSLEQIQIQNSVEIDSEPHLSRTCKTSLLFAQLAVGVHTDCSAFPIYTPTEPLIQLHILENCFSLNYE